MPLNHSKVQENRSRTGPGWRPKDGENRVRVLPPTGRYFTEDIAFIAVEFSVHWFNLEGQGAEVSRCLQEVGQKCPACMAYKAFKESADPGLKELAKRIRRNSRYLFNIIDQNNLQGGIQKWEAPWSVWDKMMEIAGNPEWGDVLDPKKGRNWVVTVTPGSKSKTGFTTYSTVPEPRETDISGILQAEIFANWQDALDDLPNAIPEPKNAAEIMGFLADLGFPGYTKASPDPQGYDPRLTSDRQPQGSVIQQLQNPMATPPTINPTPTPQQPTPAPTPPVAQESVSPPAAASPPAQGRVDAQGREIPAGAPDCFGEYNPTLHPCPTCAFLDSCQMRYLNVS